MHSLCSLEKIGYTFVDCAIDYHEMANAAFVIKQHNDVYLKLILVQINIVQ